MTENNDIATNWTTISLSINLNKYEIDIKIKQVKQAYDQNKCHERLKRSLDEIRQIIKHSYNPYKNLIDPITRKKFEENEKEFILRCKECKNYIYQYTVEDYEKKCCICKNKYFWDHEDDDFYYIH